MLKLLSLMMILGATFFSAAGQTSFEERLNEQRSEKSEGESDFHGADNVGCAFATCKPEATFRAVGT